MARKAVVIVILALVAIAVGVGLVYSLSPAETGSTSSGYAAPLVDAAKKLKALVSAVDCGYPDKKRGWYDFEGKGRVNFCRWVGGGCEKPAECPVYFSCYLDGMSTPTGVADQNLYDENAPFDPYIKGSLSGGWSC